MTSGGFLLSREIRALHLKLNEVSVSFRRERFQDVESAFFFFAHAQMFLECFDCGESIYTDPSFMFTKMKDVHWTSSVGDKFAF